MLMWMICAGWLTAPGAFEPPILLLRHDDAVSYRVSLNPGVPRAGQTFSVEVELSESLETPDPRYGTEKPMNA
ncbi:MAG: hypothetical protein AAFQ82_23845, partial [Myxococcota bacterium]